MLSFHHFVGIMIIRKSYELFLDETKLHHSIQWFRVCMNVRSTVAYNIPRPKWQSKGFYKWGHTDGNEKIISPTMAICDDGYWCEIQFVTLTMR
mmetsp:Transcript_3744/g.4319  ORF Transcript_3744/g.4319 Transcript_3744/m.4319 type:complete len:94 (-) Transcript_3744:66-347(-)